MDLFDGNSRGIRKIEGLHLLGASLILVERFLVEIPNLECLQINPEATMENMTRTLYAN